MGCCALDDPSREKPVIPQIIGFALFLSLYLLGFVIAIFMSPFSKRARVAVVGFWTFMSVSVDEMRKGKSQKVNMLRCRLSGRTMGFSPRLAGFLYKNFLTIAVGLFITGVLVFIFSGLWFVLLILIIVGLCTFPLISSSEKLKFTKPTLADEK